MNMKEKITDKKQMDIPTGYHFTEYSEMENILISDKYSADEVFGIVSGEGTKHETTICSALTISQRRYDLSNNIEYITIKFYNDFKEEYEELSFKSSDITGAEAIKTMEDHGISIYNKSSFEWFMRSIIDADKILKRYNKTKGKRVELIKESAASDRYGYRRNEDGEYDFTKFYTKKEIVDTDDPGRIHRVLFNEKGTYEGWKYTMNKLTSECNPDYVVKVLSALMLSGVILPFCSNIANPVLCLNGISGCGKGFLVSMLATIWGNVGTEDTNGTGILRTSQDSGAAFSKIASTLYNLPLIMTEIQGILDDKTKGLSYIKKMTYDYVESSNGARATQTGEIRKNLNEWRNCLLWLCEMNISEMLMNGADSRVVTIDSRKVMNGDCFVRDTAQFGKEFSKNYGFAGKMFADAIIKYYFDNKDKSDNIIYDEVNILKKEIVTHNIKDKKANTLALLLYTYNMFVKLNLAPSSWGYFEVKDFLKCFLVDTQSNDTTSKVLEIWSENIKNDIAFPLLSEELTQAEYDEKAKCSKEVRGRKEIFEDKLIVYISEDNLKRQLEYTAKEYGYSEFIFSKKALQDRNIMIKNERTGRWVFQMKNITRTGSRGRENVYKLQFDIDTETEEEIFIKNELAKVGL